MLLAAAAPLAAQPEAPGAQGQLARLQAELAQASRSQDQKRLRDLYSQIAALQPASAEAQRGLGLACYLQGDFEAAVPALEKAASLQPGLAGVRLYLGISYYRTNRFAAALAELEQAPETQADSPLARYWQGAALRAIGRLSEAIPALEAARAGDPANPDLLNLLTRAYSEYASEWFGRLLSTAADSPAGRLLKAEELAMDSVYEAALREMEAALAEAPGQSGLYRLKGEVHWTREEYALAADSFRSELESNPCSAESHLRLAALMLDSGDRKGAAGHLRAAEIYGPEDGRVRELVGQASLQVASEPVPASADEEPLPEHSHRVADARDSYRKGQPERAGRLLEGVLRERPDHLEARRLLAGCWLELGDLEAAASQSRRILAQVPGDPGALYSLGRSYERMATNVADRLVEINPDSASVRLLRGEHFERGPLYQFDRALEEFRKARALSPSDPGVSHAIGRVLFKMKRFEQAVPYLDSALEANSSHGMANYLLGKIRLLQGDRSRAIESLRAAADARPDLADARKDLARALVLEGRVDEGISIYEGLLGAQPPDASVHALLAAAYRRAGRLEDARAQAERARALGNSTRRSTQP